MRAYACVCARACVHKFVRARACVRAYVWIPGHIPSRTFPITDTCHQVTLTIKDNYHSRHLPDRYLPDGHLSSFPFSPLPIPPPHLRISRLWAYTRIWNKNLKCCKNWLGVLKWLENNCKFCRKQFMVGTKLK